MYSGGLNRFSFLKGRQKQCTRMQRGEGVQWLLVLQLFLWSTKIHWVWGMLSKKFFDVLVSVDWIRRAFLISTIILYKGLHLPTSPGKTFTCTTVGMIQTLDTYNNLYNTYYRNVNSSKTVPLSRLLAFITMFYE